jgi:hypothetical protein
MVCFDIMQGRVGANWLDIETFPLQRFIAIPFDTAIFLR